MHLCTDGAAVKRRAKCSKPGCRRRDRTARRSTCLLIGEEGRPVSLTDVVVAFRTLKEMPFVFCPGRTYAYTYEGIIHIPECNGGWISWDRLASCFFEDQLAIMRASERRFMISWAS